MSLHRLTFLGASLVALVGCNNDPTGAACTTDENCPVGQACRQHICVLYTGMTGGGAATGGGSPMTGGGQSTGGGATTTGGGAPTGGGTSTDAGSSTGGGNSTGGGVATGGGIATGGGSVTGGGSATGGGPSEWRYEAVWFEKVYADAGLPDGGPAPYQVLVKRAPFDATTSTVDFSAAKNVLLWPTEPGATPCRGIEQVCGSLHVEGSSTSDQFAFALQAGDIHVAYGTVGSDGGTLRTFSGAACNLYLGDVSLLNDDLPLVSCGHHFETPVVAGTLSDDRARTFSQSGAACDGTHCLMPWWSDGDTVVGVTTLETTSLNHANAPLADAGFVFQSPLTRAFAQRVEGGTQLLWTAPFDAGVTAGTPQMTYWSAFVPTGAAVTPAMVQGAGQTQLAGTTFKCWGDCVMAANNNYTVTLYGLDAGVVWPLGESFATVGTASWAARINGGVVLSVNALVSSVVTDRTLIYSRGVLRQTYDGGYNLQIVRHR